MLDALSGREQLRHGLSGQCLCEVARPFGNPLDIWLWWHDQSSPNLLRHDLWLLIAFRTPVQNGLMQKSTYFAQKMITCMHFMHPPKVVHLGWGHHVDFCFWKKISHYFWRMVYGGHWTFPAFVINKLWICPPARNILKPKQNGCLFADGIFKCIFWKVTYCISIQISLKSVSKDPIDKCQQ